MDMEAGSKPVAGGGGGGGGVGAERQDPTTVYAVAIGTWLTWLFFILILWWMREENTTRKIFVRCREGEEQGRYQLSLRIGKVSHNYQYRLNQLIVTLYGRVGLDPPRGDVSSDEQEKQAKQQDRERSRGGLTIGGPQSQSQNFPPISRDPDIYTLTKFEIAPGKIFSVPAQYTTHESELRLVEIELYTARPLDPLYAIAINHSGRTGGIQIHSIHFRDLDNPGAYLMKIYMGHPAGYITHVPLTEAAARRQFFVRPIFGATVSSGIGRSVDARASEQAKEPHPRPPLNFSWIEAFLAHALSVTAVQVMLRFAPALFPLDDLFDYNYILVSGVAAGFLGLLIMFVALGLLAVGKLLRDNTSLAWYHLYNVLTIGLTGGFGVAALALSTFTCLEAENIHKEGIIGNWGMSYLIAALLMVILTFVLLMWAGMRDWMSDWTPASDRALHYPHKFIDSSYIKAV